MRTDELLVMTASRHFLYGETSHRLCSYERTDVLDPFCIILGVVMVTAGRPIIQSASTNKPKIPVSILNVLIFKHLTSIGQSVISSCFPIGWLLKAVMLPSLIRTPTCLASLKVEP